MRTQESRLTPRQASAVRLYAAFAFFVGAGLAGCAGEVKKPAASSGTGNQAAVTRALVLDDTPLVTIPRSRADEEELLTHVVGATRLPDGTVVVADGYGGHEQSIKAFNASGQPVWSAGRHGGGPGEFQVLGWLGQCGGDGVYTWDAGRATLAQFDSHGKLVREGDLPAPPLPVNLTCSRAGTFAMMTSPGQAPEAMGAQRVFSRVIVANAQGDSLAGLPEVYLGQSSPLGTITRLALSEDRLYVGTGDSAWVDEYDLKANRTGSIRIGGALRPATAHHFDRAIDQMLNTMAGAPADRAMIKKMMLALTKMPEHLPPYTALLTDPDGDLWVVTTVPGDDSTAVRVYSPAGDSLATLQLPAEMRLFEIGDDYILGALADSTGQEFVTEYRYHRDQVPQGSGSCPELCRKSMGAVSGPPSVSGAHAAA